MLTVEELMEKIKTMDKKAVVVINGEVVHSVETVVGKTKEGYGKTYFNKNEKGKVKALLFTKVEEGSDGSFFERNY